MDQGHKVKVSSVCALILAYILAFPTPRIPVILSAISGSKGEQEAQLPQR